MMEDDDNRTKDALFRVIEDCLHNPDKKKNYINEGTLGLLLEICGSNKSPGVKAYAAATMAVFCHQNPDAKTEVIEQGGSRTLLSLCKPLGDSNNDSVSTKMDRLLVHKQSVAVLQKLTYEHIACQADLVNSGIIRHLIQLCDIFNPESSHSNCCQVTANYSKQANEVFSELTMNKKLIGNITEMSSEESAKKMESMIQFIGDASHCDGKVYKVDLFDTTTDKDIRISSELKSTGLVWPDLSYIEELDKERQSPVKEVKPNSTWCDISVMQVIDAGHFWAYVGGETVHKVSLCCLSGVQAPSQHVAVLEYAAGSLRNLTEFNEDFISYIATSGGIEALLKLCFIPNKKILVQALSALGNLALDLRYKARIGFLGGIKIFLNLCLQYDHDNDIMMHAVGAIRNVLVNSVINRSRALDAYGLNILIHGYMEAKKEELKNQILRALKNLIGGQDGEAASTNRSNQMNPLDLTSVMDRNPTSQKEFTLSVATDAYDGSNQSTRNCRRRRARRKGLVDPKPTQVSMSLDLLEKSTSNPSDSESDSDDSDDSYSGRWTSEIDTDAEMLIKDKTTTKIPTKITQLAESLKSDRYYVQTHHMVFKEDETHEFSSQTNVYGISKKRIAKSLCAFLNNKKCGTIYIGVRSNGEISGVRVKRKERDLLRIGLDEMVGSFKPPLKHDMYKIDFIPVARPAGYESITTRNLIEDRFVIEILLLKYTGFIYTTPQGKCFFRHKSANIELTTQEVRERTIQEQETSYNEEIKRLRKELKGMRKQLSERSQGSSIATNSDTDKSTPTVTPKTNFSQSSTNKFTSHDDDVQASGCVVM